MTTYRLISADSHVNPPIDFWKEYLPAHLQDRAPRLEVTPDGDFIVFEGNRSPVNMLSSLAGKKKEHFKLHGKVDETCPGGFDPSARLKDMAADGVDGEVLYGGGPLITQDPELALASYTAYNRWLADFCSAAPDHLFGQAYIPVQDVEQAIDEARRAVKQGLKGAVVPSIPPGPPYSDPSYEPLWSTLEDLGLMVHMHLGTRRTRFDSAPNFLVDHVMSKLGMAEPIALFIYSGILQRHPRLKLVSVESGFGWAAFVIHYMDHSWGNHRYWTGSELKEPPSYYFRRQIVGTFMDDPLSIRERHTFGVDNLMFFTDYPHSETSWPDSRKIIDAQLQGVPEDEKQQIMAGNAVRLYHLN